VNRSIIITGLDIGSSKVSAVALELFNTGRSVILAYESQPSKGINRGVLTDIAEASNSVAKVLTRLGAKTLKGADNIYANISGESVMGERSKGMIPLSSRGREVTNSDITRCVNAASTIRLAYDREVIHKIVLSFSIDDQPPIKNALDLYASRLSCEMYMITANLNHIQNIYKCVNDAGYDVKEVVYSGIADSVSLLEEAWKDEGAALINMGASLTELSYFSGGALSFLDIMPLGGSDIKGGIKDDGRFNEMASRIKSRTEEFLKKGGSVRSFIITGGLAFSEGVAETLEERLGCPVRMGTVRNVQGNISSTDGLRAVTAIGLARYAASVYQTRSAQAKTIARKISNKVVEIFNNYF